MKEVTKRRLIAIGVATAFFAGISTLVMPFAGEIFAGLAVAGALFGLAMFESKKRAY